MKIIESTTGRWGESIARDYLERQGLRFIAANWACKLGEIDLIMQDGPTRVFIEVRFRSNASYGSSADTVAWLKQKKLIRVAKAYQQRAAYWGDCRFDVVAIAPGQGVEPVIDHIKDAFSVS